MAIEFVGGWGCGVLGYCVVRSWLRKRSVRNAARREEQRLAGTLPFPTNGPGKPVTFRQAMLLDCPVCETERTDGAVFCGQCGWKLPPRASGKPQDDCAKALIAASMVIRPEHLDFDRI